MNEQELRNLMYTAQLENKGPFTIRYPRGNGVMTDWKTPFQEIPVGKGRRVSSGEGVAILTLGHPGNFAQEAIKTLTKSGITPAHYDLRFVKPLDEMLLHEVFSKFDKVITVEDGCLMGGFGSAVLEFMADRGYKAEVVRLGIPDEYIHHGTQEELWATCGFDVAAIVSSVERILMVDLTKTAGVQLG
jgi:1-deoxy-D-xylulose-5-phosphate synthase